MFNYINRGPIPSLKSGSSKKTIPIILVANEDLKKWQQSLSNNQQSWLKLNDFNATSGEILLFIANNGAVDFVAAGMGENNSSTIEQDPIEPWLFSKIAKSVPKGTYQISNILNDRDANSAAFGWAMAHYKFSVYLKETKQKLSILTVPKNCDINFVSHMVRGSTLCRDLVNTPTCHMGPDDLGEVSKSLAREFKAKITIITGAALLKAGFNTIHTVGRAAEKEPRLIDITWGNQKAPKITLVGKGVCFDTGGLDIKPSNSMLNMKKDMGGAAHVLGLGQMIMEAGLNVRLRILIPAVENNISANAFRPGDIIKSYHGTTIEIGNTDAEGRLVLCDALALASEENPDLLITKLTRFMFPIIIIFALYLQIHGEISPGGGFQAGAVIAIAFILYAMAFGDQTLLKITSLNKLKNIAVTGVALYFTTGLCGLLGGLEFLNYNVFSNNKILAQKIGIITIELGVGITVSATMLLIYFCLALSNHESNQSKL